MTRQISPRLPQADSPLPPGPPTIAPTDSPGIGFEFSKHHALPKPASLSRRGATHHCGDRLPTELASNFQNTTPCPSRLLSPAAGPPTTAGTDSPGIGFESSKHHALPKPAPIARHVPTHHCGDRLPRNWLRISKPPRPAAQAGSHRPPRGHPPLRGSTSPRNWLRISKTPRTAQAGSPSPAGATRHCGDRLPRGIGFEFSKHHTAPGRLPLPATGAPPLRGSAPHGIGCEFQNTTPPQAGFPLPPRGHPPLRGSAPHGIGFEFQNTTPCPSRLLSPATGPPTTAGTDFPRNWLRISKPPRPAQAGSHRRHGATHPCGDRLPRNWLRISKHHALPKPAPISRRGATHHCGDRVPRNWLRIFKTPHRPRPAPIARHGATHHCGDRVPRNWLRIFKTPHRPRPTPIARHGATHHCGDRLPRNWLRISKTPRTAQAGSHRPPRAHPPLWGSAPSGSCGKRVRRR
jgi:hypothetical protein